jgi:hypothetical protein
MWLLQGEKGGIHMQFWVRKPRRERPPATPRRRWEGNIKIHVREVGCEVDGIGSESYPIVAFVVLTVSIYMMVHGNGQVSCNIIIIEFIVPAILTIYTKTFKLK